MPVPIPWYEEWFCSPYYRKLYEVRDNAEAARFIQALINKLKPAQHASFMDLACGYGRHAKALSEAGYTTSGVDLCAEFIQEAMDNCKHLPVEFHHADMRNPLPGGPYDYILSLFTSFGYFEDEKEDLLVLKNIVDAMKPQAYFILDYVNVEKLKATLNTAEKIVEDDCTYYLERAVDEGFIVKTIKIVSDNKEEYFTEKIKALELEAIEGMLNSQGLLINQVFGDYELGPFEESESDRLIILAAKA